jgi:hypothetical protein
MLIYVILEKQMRKRLTDDNSTKVIDLASTLKEAQDESKTYICSECGNDLVYDKTYRLRNPFAGEGFFCSNINKCSMFGKIQDISLVKLKVKPRPVKGAISNLKDASQEVMISFVDENKGGLSIENEYEKISQRFEPSEDERLRLSGAKITRSEIILTDSSGMNRTLVKRKNE